MVLKLSYGILFVDDKAMTQIPFPLKNLEQENRLIVVEREPAEIKSASFDF